MTPPTPPTPARPVAVAVSGRGLVDPALPVLRADDEGFARGTAVFETLRVYGGVPFRLTEHVARLRLSAERLELIPPNPEHVGELARVALDAARLGDGVLRLYWTPGAAGDEPRGIALVAPLPAGLEAQRLRGLRVVTLAWPRRDVAWLLPSTKSVSYATHLAAQREAARRGADDAVFVDPDGVVLECPVSNIWWREGKRLLTPSLELGILAGETRAALLELATGLGYAIEQGAFSLESLAGADEAFTTSSVREVMPVVRLDGRTIPRGPAAEELQAALRQLATSR